MASRGANFSGGQKQLLTIARAMLLDAPMLILDEATSNVDTETERAIQAAILTLMQGRTCFVITHRLSTIQNADQIIVLQNGAAAECGTHKELMARGDTTGHCIRHNSIPRTLKSTPAKCGRAFIRAPVFLPGHRSHAPPRQSGNRGTDNPKCPLPHFCAACSPYGYIWDRRY